MNFLLCPLADVWISASQPEGLAGLAGDHFESDVGAAAARGANAKSRIHSLMLGQIVWLGARLPVYLAHWEIERSGSVKSHGVELVFPLDPWDLGESEAFCRAVCAAGIGLIPLPVAPVSPSFEAIEVVDRPGWKIPDEEALARRARELLQLQVVGLAEWGCEAEPLIEIDWVGSLESLAVLTRYEERLRWAWTKRAEEKEGAI